MPNVEVDQGQFEAASKAQRLLNDLLSDAKQGMTVKRAIKAKYPEAVIPDLELVESLAKPFNETVASLREDNAALKQALDEFKQQTEVKEAKGKLVSDLDAIKTKFGFTDDGMAQVVETMQSRNLAHDPEAAAALVQANMPKPQPTSSRSSLISPNLDVYGLQSDKAEESKWALLHSHPWDFFNNEVVSVFDEMGGAAA